MNQDRNQVIGSDGIVVPYSTHHCRRFFATRLYLEGYSEDEIAKLLSHTSKKITQDHYIIKDKGWDPFRKTLTDNITIYMAQGKLLLPS